VTLAIVRRLLRFRKRQLERRVIGVPDYARRDSLELDRVVAALDVLA
jgi:hypothetical protein